MATAAPAIKQATYKTYGTVSVIAEEGGLSQIRTQSDIEFWVPTENLKAMKEPKVVYTGPRVVEPKNKTPECWAALIAYLYATGYTLRAQCREDGQQIVETEYREWSGEDFPEVALRHYENRPTPREWRLSFSIKDFSMELPFALEIMGTTGNKPTQRPRGLLATNGRVEVYFASIVQQLVRAGLRATTD